jgi:hypothetical protein
MTYSVRMVGVKLAILGVLVAVGCTRTNPAAFCADGTCSDPNFAYCDVDGAVSGEPGMCIAVTCTPGEVKQCHDGAAMTCNAGGNGYEDVACDLGCAETPTAHCKYLQPKYMPDICDAHAPKTSLTLSGVGSLDPNLDASCDEVIAQAGGPGVCVVRAGTITIASSANLKVLGTTDATGRAIAFVADEQIRVDGAIEAGGHLGVNGPAGGTYASGGLPNGSTLGAGGGAGGATSGAPGATQTRTSGGTDGGASNGGAAVMNPALLASFIGGGSSGAIGPAFMGGGGGALMFVSCHGEVAIAGTINAGGGGGGGAAGIAETIFAFIAHGGGAGGNVVIQGVSVDVTGQVFANGGAGGGGWQSTGAQGMPGADGTLSDASGAAGGNVVGGSGHGGMGGYKDNIPTQGTHPTANETGAGGGGGSVGFLQTYTPSGVPATLTPAHVSPAFQPNGVVELR